MRPAVYDLSATEVRSEPTVVDDNPAGTGEPEPFLQEKFKLLSDALEIVHNKPRHNIQAGTYGQGLPAPRIQKATPILRKKEILKKYFEPKVYSFGPIHHGSDVLKRGEAMKLKLAALYISTYKLDKNFLFGKIKKEIGTLKLWYEEDAISNYNDNQLSWMLFVDGCALLFYIAYFGNYLLRNSFSGDFRPEFAHDDIFLLENQIPYQALETLMVPIKENQHYPFSKLDLLKNIESFVMRYCVLKNVKNLPVNRIASRNHLLDLLWKTTKQSAEQGRTFARYLVTPLYLFHSVQVLKSVGIKLRPSKSPLDTKVSLNKGCIFGELKIPPLWLEYSSGSTLANLMAYEMCSDNPNELEITSYIWFINSLAKDANDIAEMQSMGTLYNYLPSNEAAFELLQVLASDLVPNPNIYNDVKQEIDIYLRYHKTRNKIASWFVEAAQMYFRTPWTTIAFFAAALAFSLGLVSTIFTIFPPSG